VRSLSDVLVSVRQISEISCNKEMYLQKASVLDKTLKGKTLLVAKYCHHDICNPNIIASTSFNSYYTYFMMKFSVNLYLNFHERLKTIDNYFEMSKELDNINSKLRDDLQRYVTYTKRKNFILTKDSDGEVNIN
jgi:hypothetical protein